MIEIKHKSSGAVLVRVDSTTLRSAVLSHCDLAGADLAGADLSYALLTGANLEEADLDKASLMGASLDHSNLSYASIAGADLTDAQLRHTRLYGARFDGSLLRYAHLTAAKLIKTSLVGADLSMADARDADFAEADLRRADLRGINLLDASLHKADLTGADLTGATLTHALLKGAQLQGAKVANIVTRDVPAEDDSPFAAGILRRLPADLPDNSIKPIVVNIRCPECSAPLKISGDRLDHHVTCSTCHERFFVDRTGVVHLKKPVAKMDWEPELHRDQPEPKSWEISEKGVNIFVGVGLSTIAIVLLGLLVTFAVNFWRTPPSDLRGRALVVADALVYSDDDQLQVLAAEGMEVSTVTWFRELRSQRWELIHNDERDVSFDARVQSEDRGARSARVSVQVNSVSDTDGNSKKLSFDIPWVLDDRGDWRINSNLLGALPAEPEQDPATTAITP